MAEHDSQPAPSGLRLPSLPDRLPVLERILTEAIEDPHVKPYRDRALFTFFCGFEPQDVAGYDAQLEAVGRCLEWFVFDYVIPDLQCTPAQRWFDQREESLSPQDHLEAYQCLSFILGLFEVFDISTGRGFWVADLLRGQSLYVREYILSREIQEGQLLLARLFPWQEAHCLSGMATVMGIEATADVKTLLAEGILSPPDVLSHLDGVELENLFGRTLEQIERLEDLALLHRQMQRYLEPVTGRKVAFSQFLSVVNKVADPFNVTAFLCEKVPIVCRHEMDLIMAYVMACWFATHKP